LTAQNYAELQTLYEKYNSRGLEILAFPCNQFGKQEPGSNAEVQEFARNRGATFPVLGKLEVNGPGEDPLYSYLKSKKGGLLGSAIKWNFSKFLCTNGVPVKRYAPTDSPLSFEKDIEAELEKGLLRN
jgi:glutathione peroxidase